ncbi:VanZ family protein [Pedobacter sp. BS3]|uniref:VanZ family protein n=1 Tax=Pedobacter sp. BS3 TaxID=2567937 RepID=UPI0011EE78A5|nr:VanZ family protein [Pedobacter sp. BS3]TZF82213.1 VanZ family protein [Pedobacter sp. BS3]
MIRALRYQYLALIWAIFVLILCDMPLSPDEGGIKWFEGFDKLTHTGFFFVFTVLLLYGKIRQQNSYQYRPLTIIKITLLGAILGGGIELLQWKVFTYRSAEWWDFFCDMVGIAMGVFSYVLLHRKTIYEKTH